MCLFQSLGEGESILSNNKIMSNRRKYQAETRSVLKVLILGDGAVGKSCIMTRFINDQFEDNSFHTIGVEFLNKDFLLNEKNYTLQVHLLKKINASNCIDFSCSD